MRPNVCNFPISSDLCACFDVRRHDAATLHVDGVAVTVEPVDATMSNVIETTLPWGDLSRNA